MKLCQPRFKKRNFELTETEEDLFSVLKHIRDTYQSDLQLRVAGGWVRDKILGVPCKDIDFALNISGDKFAGYIADYYSGNVKEYKIRANPEKSKHLETVRMDIPDFDMTIDFVNLRKEFYSDHSRIPHIEIGTPLDDSQRRDLTINSLFYNPDTDNIEDWCGQGLIDIENKVIRTPQNAMITFKEDPLRIFRAIKYSIRLDFDITEDVKMALGKKELQNLLDLKVSRERINDEVYQMLLDNPIRSFQYFLEYNLLQVIFDPSIGNDFSQSMECITYFHRYFEILLSPSLLKQKHWIYMFIFLLPYTNNTGHSTVIDIILTKHNTNEMKNLFKLSNWDFLENPDFSRLEIGMTLRRDKNKWPISLANWILSNCKDEKDLKNKVKLILEKIEIFGLSDQNTWLLKPLVPLSEIIEYMEVKERYHYSHVMRFLTEIQMEYPSYTKGESLSLLESKYQTFLSKGNK